MSFGVRAPSPGTGSWGSEAPPAPPGTEPSRGLPGGGCCPGARYLAAGPAAVASLARAALRTVGSWEVWTGCPSLPRLVPQAPLRVPGRKALRVLQGEENAGRRPPEKPTTSGQVHGAAAARRLSRCRPPHPSPRPPTPPLCLPHSPPRGPRLGRSFFPGRPGCSRTLCIPGATDRADSTGVCGPGGGGPGPLEPHGRSDLRGRLQLPGAPGLPDGPGLGAASLPRPPPSPRGLASVSVCLLKDSHLLPCPLLRTFTDRICRGPVSKQGPVPRFCGRAAVPEDPVSPPARGLPASPHLSLSDMACVLRVDFLTRCPRLAVSSVGAAPCRTPVPALRTATRTPPVHSVPVTATAAGPAGARSTSRGASRGGGDGRMFSAVDF